MNKPIDFSKVQSVVYHLAEGEEITFQVEALLYFLELSHGHVCDTSAIDGKIHFFPRGNA